MCEHMCLYARYMVTYHVCTHVVYTYTCVCCVFPYVSRVYGHTYLCVCWAYMNTCACCHMCMSLKVQVHMRVYSHTHQSQVDDSG